jgi:hypothetical protein
MEFFFPQPNSFLAIILQLSIPKLRLNSIPLLSSLYLGRLALRHSTLCCYCQRQSHIATDGQSISKSWCRAPIYCTLIGTFFLFWGALSDERTNLSFVYVSGPRQRSFSRIRVPWDSWPYFTISDLRLPISSFGILPYNHFARTT